MANSLDMNLEIKGVNEVKAMLTGVGLDINDLRGAMDDVGTSTIKLFSGQVFASRGGFLGQPWQRLSEPYASWKAKRFAGRPPLVRTGKMQGSFTKNVQPMSVTIGNSDFKFPFHQSSAPRSKIPRRAMIGVYNGMQNYVTNTIAQALSRKIKQRTG